MFRLLNTIPGALLFAGLVTFASCSNQKADAGWWNWNQPTAEEKCEDYVRGRLNNHASANVRNYAWYFTPQIVDLIKDRNSGRMSAEASRLFVKARLKAQGATPNAAEWITEIATKEIEEGRQESNCAQIR